MASLFLLLSPHRAVLLQRDGGFRWGRPRRFKLLAAEPRTIAGRELITELVRGFGRCQLEVVVDNGDELCHIRPISHQLRFARGALLASEREQLFGSSPYVSARWLGGRLPVASLVRRLRRLRAVAAAGADTAEKRPALRLLGLTEEGDLPLWLSALEHAGCSLRSLGCGPLLWEQAAARLHRRGPLLLLISDATARLRHLFFIDGRLLFVRSTAASAEALGETLQYLRGRFATGSAPGAGLTVVSIAAEEALADLGELVAEAVSHSHREATGAELRPLSFADLGRIWGAPSGDPALLAALFHSSSGRRTHYRPPLLSARLIRRQRRRWLLAVSGLLLLAASASAVIDGRKSLLHSDRGERTAAAAQASVTDCRRLYEGGGLPPARMHALSQLFLQVRAKRQNSPLLPLGRLEQVLACCPQLQLLQLEWSAKKGLVAEGRVEDADIERGSASFNRLIERLARGGWRVELGQRPFSMDGKRALRLTFAGDSGQSNGGRGRFEFRLFFEGS